MLFQRGKTLKNHDGRVRKICYSLLTSQFALRNSRIFEPPARVYVVNQTNVAFYFAEHCTISIMFIIFHEIFRKKFEDLIFYE